MDYQWHIATAAVGSPCPWPTPLHLAIEDRTSEADAVSVPGLAPGGRVEQAFDANPDHFPLLLDVVRDPKLATFLLQNFNPLAYPGGF